MQAITMGQLNMHPSESRGTQRRISPVDPNIGHQVVVVISAPSGVCILSGPPAMILCRALSCLPAFCYLEWYNFMPRMQGGNMQHVDTGNDKAMRHSTHSALPRKAWTERRLQHVLRQGDVLEHCSKASTNNQEMQNNQQHPNMASSCWREKLPAVQ